MKQSIDPSLFPAVSPSLLAAPREHIEEALDLAFSSGAKFIHIDVMDGKFVEAKTFSIKEVAAICEHSKMINDVHIMIEDPLSKALSYVKAGADILTFHYEACKDDEEVAKTIRTIKEAGALVGLSIKPATPISVLKPFIEELDLVLLMSVEPGKGGQSFIENSNERMKGIVSMAKGLNKKLIKEIDGGINKDTSIIALSSGADLLVAGSFLFGHSDFKSRLLSLTKGK